MLTVLFAAISLLYATVGQAGGTALLALMAFASFPRDEMRPTALVLNILAAALATLLFNRDRLVDWQKLRPFLLASLPTALVGGFIVLDAKIYNLATGLVLLAAAVVLVARRAGESTTDRVPPLAGALGVGACVGVVSGLTGVGGGVFLAPILIGLRWATPKETSAMSPPFIFANSVVGLAGALYTGQSPAADMWLYAVACLFGAAIGANIGARWISQAATRYVLAAILGSGGMQLFLLSFK
jgi:uncharacterized membrane protein YfcA